MEKVFVTGTDTGVGKSIFVSAFAISNTLRGKKVVICKPIQTGIPKDTDFLANLTQDKIPIFNTYSFELGAAPLVAAKEEGVTIEISKIVSDIRRLEREYDVVIVEGIGGLAVPITNSCHPEEHSDEGSSHVVRSFSNAQNDTYLVADLVKDLKFPVIIVARPTLGTINHSVLTIEFAKEKKLNISGFVISGYSEKTTDVVIKTAPEIISMVTGVKCLMKLPIIDELNYDSLLTSAVSLSSKAPSARAKV